MSKAPGFGNEARLTLVDSSSAQNERLSPSLEVPVLAETLLRLHLESQERSVDLRKVSELVLGDLGATIQVLRLANRESGGAGGPMRIEDCIADIGIHQCLSEMSVGTALLDRQREVTAKLWKHSKAIGTYSKLIAEQMSDMYPEHAYLVGLLHAIRWLPAILGWRARVPLGPLGESAQLHIAKLLSLPGTVLELLSEDRPGGSRVRWSDILKMAHQLAIALPLDSVEEDSGSFTLRERFPDSLALGFELASLFEGNVIH